MVFMLCSAKQGEQTASISFSGGQLAKFGFEAGCRVSVDISKDQIIIKPIDEMSVKCTNNKYFERR